MTRQPGNARQRETGHPLRSCAAAAVWITVNIDEIVVAVAMAVMSVLIFVQVILRYVFNSPWSWIEEVSIICFVWIVFAGASVAYKWRRHIIIDLVVHILPARPRRIVEGLTTLVTVAVLALLSVSAAQLSVLYAAFYLPIVPLPLNVFTLPICIFSVIMLLRAVADLAGRERIKLPLS